MENLRAYRAVAILLFCAGKLCLAGSSSADDQMILSELMKNIFQVKNNDPVYSLFKDQTVQQNDLFGSIEKMKSVVSRMAEGKLDGHLKKIQTALDAYFSAIDNIRAYLKSSINTGSSEWLNNYEANDTRLNMKTDFEKLNKKTIDTFVDQLTAAQKTMNSAFGVLSKPIFKAESYKRCYDALKKIAEMVNDLIKNFVSGKTWATLPELFELMKQKSGSSFSLFKKKPEKGTTGTLIENGKVVKF